VLAPLLARAAARQVLVVVDPKGRDFARYRGAQVLTPNLKELAEADGRPPGEDDAGVTAQAARVMDAAGLPALVVTRSERGLSVVRRAGDGRLDARHHAAEAREVFDVSGAGDTVVATLAAALAGLAARDADRPAAVARLEGGRLDAAGRLANLAGGIVVGKAGTAVVTAEELARTRARQRLGARAGKVAGLDGARERVAAWRASGLSVAFTNGVFDLLHPGHLSLIDQSRAAADRLVVAINSDASVKRLKGPARPVQDETARAAVLASLEAVDLVLVFDEDTPLETIRALAPDVLVKGADYTVDTVVGADVVMAAGGRVLLADLSPGHSTTATIARLAPATGDRS
jgi:D-beta-D-heptose 7-phosphate kinase/D-beta-D-heptose 1-phosphate adenosyltransferase